MSRGLAWPEGQGDDARHGGCGWVGVVRKKWPEEGRLRDAQNQQDFLMGCRWRRREREIKNHLGFLAREAGYHVVRWGQEEIKSLV